MTHPNDFYSFTDGPNKDSQKRMWKNIKREVTPKRGLGFGSFEIKSFSFGFAAAILAFFAVVGFYSTISKLSEQKLPDHVRVNNAYFKAIADVEQVLPLVNKDDEKTIYVDDMIISRREELKDINSEIYRLGGEDYSKIKQLRLREYYRLKLKIIDEIIAMEEIDYE